MTVPTNTDQVYTQTNIREDLINFVYNVDPFRTPFFSMCKKAEAKQTYHEWDVDNLAAAGANAAVEGDNPTNIALTATGRMGNYTQISNKTIQLSGTLQSVVAAGGTNKMGYQLAKKAKELKRDLEYNLTNNHASAVGTSSTARYSAGLPAFLATNFLSVATTPGTAASGHVSIGSVNFGNGTATYTAGTGLNAVTESNVKTVLVDVYNNSGDSPEYLLVSPKNKQIISTFTGPGTRFIEVDDATLKTKVDVYESDFGDVKLIPDIFLASSASIFGINPNYARIAYLRPFQTIPLAKTGDSDQKMLLVEWTLECGNEHAHCFIADTTG